MSELKNDPYPKEVIQWANQLIAENKLGSFLLERYPSPHNIITNNDLYYFAAAIKSFFFTNSAPLNRVRYDDEVRPVHGAMARYSPQLREIQMTSDLRHAPIEILRAIVVHELAHLPSLGHDAAFYQRCEYMEPDYHKLEFHAWLYLVHLDNVGVLYPETEAKH
jgi:UTP pyrophosphatase